MRVYLYWIMIALPILLLVGCQGSGSASTDEAVTQQILKQPPAGAVIDPASIEVLQTQAFEGSQYVVVSYQRMWNNRDETCLAMLETHYEFLTGWIAGSGGGACTERDRKSTNAGDPIHLSGGTQMRADQKKPDISHVLGKVNDPVITKVRVTWRDGQSQEAEVIKGSFIALRTGRAEISTAQGISSENDVVYELRR